MNLLDFDKPLRAIGFHSIVGAAMPGGAALAATEIDPIATLFRSR